MAPLFEISVLPAPDGTFIHPRAAERHQEKCGDRRGNGPLPDLKSRWDAWRRRGLPAQTVWRNCRRGGTPGVGPSGRRVGPAWPGTPCTEDLQGDLAVELRVGGLPHLAHPALAKEGGDVVVADRSAGTEGHDLLSLLTGPFYAEPVHGSTRRRRSARSGPSLIRPGRPNHYTGILNKVAALPPRMATRSASLNPGVSRT